MMRLPCNPTLHTLRVGDSQRIIVFTILSSPTGDVEMYSPFEKLEMLTQTDYEQAFLTIQRKMTKKQLQMLTYHYHATDKSVVPSELARLAGYKSINVVNSQYGTIGSYLCRVFNLNYRVKLNTLVHFEDRLSPPDQYVWIMRDNAYNALSSLGWFSQP